MWHISRQERNRTIHKRLDTVKRLEQDRFKLRYFLWVIDRPRFHKRDFPYIDLPIRDDVGSRGRQVPIDARPNAVDALAYINRNLIEIAKSVNANLISQLPLRVPAKR